VSRAFHQRVAITSSGGQHIRYVPAAIAGAMVAGGAAMADASAGRIRSVVLVRTAASFATPVGPPSFAGIGVRFYRWQRLDESASRVVEHHPRCTHED
jgi:hypothetical protein